ncbi:MAG: tetratricopeptide repeat protein [Planctomycetes bacterium]|nr:tetratricopeptide repeat protein [Planctomycetota bacterium]
MPSDLWDRAMHDADHGRLNEALAMVRMRQRMKPRDPEATELLGLLLFRAGEVDQAIHFLQRGVELLANVLDQVGRTQEAIRLWDECLRINPDFVLAWMGLATACQSIDDSARSIRAGERGLALAPDWIDMVRNHSNTLARAGRVEEAAALLRAYLAAHPEEAELRSNLLMNLHYRGLDAAAMLAEHRAFGAALPAASPPASTSLDGRTLRIGVLSADLRGHSVASFADALIRHAPNDVELVALSTAAPGQSDDTTAGLKPFFAKWLDVAGLRGDVLDACIRAERIDVLLELSGHSGGNRLADLARKPAPMIVSAIGYPDTTGLPAVDARIVDSITDPSGAESRCTEHLVRIDPCFLCYRPPELAPEPVLPPEGAPITFGSFNNHQKIAPETAETWAHTLRAVPGSRLLLKSPGLGDPMVRAGLVARLSAAGIPADAIELVAFAKGRTEHLALYNRVHVALDTMPYNGTTTTCEALWMGVPLVTTLGDHHAARVSASLLHAAGLGDLVATGPDAFAKIAAQLALDKSRLTSLRGGLRAQLLASALLDAKRYARQVHAALRALFTKGPGAQARAG